MVQPCSPTRPPPLLNPGVSALQRQFHTSPYWSIRQLVCEIDRERIVLRGTVPTYYLKQVAQSLALKAIGIERLHSDIEVQPDGEVPFDFEATQRN
jgi:hypothetical protein